MRLIDAEELKNSYAKMIAKLEAGSDGYLIPFIAEMAISALMDCIKYEPTIEAKPVVHAHWVNYNDLFPCQCSNCNGFALSFDIDNYRKEIKSDFCPHCGAQMDELVSNTDELNSSVKIPVISMEDVPKLAKEMEK